MERLTWSDERLDKEIAAIDDRFDHFFGELQVKRDELGAGFVAIRGELQGLRGELEGLRGECDGLRTDVGGLRTELVNLRRDVHADHVALQRHVLTLMAALVIALIGLLGAFVAAQI